MYHARMQWGEIQKKFIFAFLFWGAEVIELTAVFTIIHKHMLKKTSEIKPPKIHNYATH